MERATDAQSRRVELGRFLKARRARVSPEAAGVTPYGGRRRVPGLRREELAQLAGVSADYYVRLEQGRGGNVSQGVLDAIARALDLDESERAYVAELARPVRRGSRMVRPQRVSQAARMLLDAVGEVPAYIIGHRTDVLAWNALAAAVFVDFGRLAPQQRNWARLVFRDDVTRELFADWDGKARDTVSFLRLGAGQHPDDPQLAELIGELSMHSEEFRRLWAEHRVRDKSAGTKAVNHPLAGELSLTYSTWRASDSPDQVLIVYVPATTATKESLQLLGSWTGQPGTDEPAGSVTQPTT